MKKFIQKTIENFIRDYEKSSVTKWGSPLVGFAAAEAVEEKMPGVMAGHGLPGEAVDGAKTVIAYFVPFTKELAESNRKEGLASPEWARAYEETNAMLGEINSHLVSVLAERGYRAAVHPAAGSFDREKLVSSWSHRHIAYLAGLGTFGINNMLITEQGCCGRFSTLVTDIDVPADGPAEGEACGFLRDGTCGLCMEVCPAGALTPEGFNRHKCYEVCCRNAEIYTDFGSSYDSDVKSGSEVCGKCIAGMPCAFL